jgi:hypothetical protein
MRRRTGLLLVAFAILLGACKVDAVVTIKVDDDGSGSVTAEVTLDAEAVRAAETPEVRLRDAVRLDDLEAAGWEVSPWERHEDGSATIEVTKDFDRAEDATEVVAELSGPDGPLQDVDVERDVSTFRTQWSFSGVADLEDLNTGLTNDEELVARLTAARVDVAALDAQLLLRTRDAFTLTVVADLPDAGGHTFEIAPGTVRELEADSSQSAGTRMFLFAGGLVVVVLGVLVFLFGEGRDLRRRRRLAAAMPRSGRGVALFDAPDEVEDADDGDDGLFEDRENGEDDPPARP